MQLRLFFYASTLQFLWPPLVTTVKQRTVPAATEADHAIRSASFRDAIRVITLVTIVRAVLQRHGNVYPLNASPLIACGGAF